MPSFLLLVSPILSLNYHDALVVFDAFQFALLPLMALLLYRLLSKKNLATTFVVMVIVFLPFPLPHIFGSGPRGKQRFLKRFSIFLLST